MQSAAGVMMVACWQQEQCSGAYANAAPDLSCLNNWPQRKGELMDEYDFDDDDDCGEDMDDCAFNAETGTCALAGTDYCDFECTFDAEGYFED